MNRNSKWIQCSIGLGRFTVLGFALFLPCLAVGQEDAVPLLEDGQDLLARRNENFWKGESARRALQSGLYELAERYAEEAWRGTAESDGERKAELWLLRIDAFLGSGEYEEAQSLIDSIGARGERDSASVLREAVLALVAENAVDVSRHLEAIEPSGFDSGERAWHSLILGWQKLKSGDVERSRSEFVAAKRFADRQSPALAAQIAYLSFRYQLEAEDFSVSIEELRLSYEANRGLETGFRYAQLLAVALSDEGRSEEALEVVSVAIEELPEVYADFRDQFSLLQLLFSGADSDLGQTAARRLVVEGGSLSLQRIALQHLISESLGDEGRLGDLLAETLDSIVDSESAHPLAAEALYYRAVRRYQLKEYPELEDDAIRLMNDYPDSPYKRGILTLLASSSWQRERFRTAASYLSQVRSEFAASLDKETLSILIAECLFRAGLNSGDAEDFSNAADAYEVALSGSPAKAVASQVFFQLVLSHLKAGALETAKSILDDPERGAKSDSRIVWQAEWMLIKHMRGQGESESKAAYERISRFLNLEGMNSGLHLRMLWLGSKLAYESGLYGETRVWIDRMNEVLEEAGNSDPAFVAQVRSDGLLTLAESHLELNEEQEGLALLVRLREEYEGSESALRSYIVEARYLSSRDLVVEAMSRLTFLFDTYPNSKFAPLAIYETALNAEKRGQGEYLTQANELLDRIAKDYPESDLVFYARLKQGDLLRRLNKFGTAELVYELLENTYKDRPDRYLAQISLADTLIAQASEDPSKFEAGIARLELLMDLPNVPIELRVEASYKRGNAWENQGDREKAKSAYWDLYYLFGVDKMRIQQLGKKGQYWLSRAMFELAEIFEDQAELDIAVEFYEKIEALGLLGGAVARDRVDQIKGRVSGDGAP